MTQDMMEKPREVPAVSPEANAATRGTLGAIHGLIDHWMKWNALHVAPPPINAKQQSVTAEEVQAEYQKWLGREKLRLKLEAEERQEQASLHARAEARAAEETRTLFARITQHPSHDEHEKDYYASRGIVAHRDEALCKAFERYMAVGSQPNPFYAYIQKYLKKGFSPDEWSILSAGITFRGMPTSGDLMYKDMVFRNAGLHTHFARDNLIEEIGGGKHGEPSHAKLLFDSLQMLHRHLPGKSGKPGSIPMIDDVCSHAIAEQLLQFRCQGVQFDRLKELPPLEFIDWHQYEKAQVERAQNYRPVWDFNALCRAKGLLLPHMVRSQVADGKADLDIASYVAKLEGVGQRDRLPLKDPAKRRGLTELWHDFIDARREEFTLGLYSGLQEFIHARQKELSHGFFEGLKRFLTSQKEEFQNGWWHGGEEFIAAQRIIDLLPNEAFLDYGIGTRKNQLADPHNPYDAQFALNQAMDLLAREANSKGHVKAFLDLTRQHLGYIDTPQDRKKALKWGDIHEGVQYGVEEDHAALAQDLLMIIAKASTPGNRFNATMLTNALNFVVDQGYFKLQYDHMQHIVEAMQAARNKAKAEGTAFVMPKPLDPEKMSWVDTLCEVSNGVRRTGRGLTQ